MSSVKLSDEEMMGMVRDIVESKKWIMILVPILLMIFRIIIVSFIIFLSGVLFQIYDKILFRTCIGITLKSVKIFVLLSVAVCVWNLFTNSSNNTELYKYTSLLYFFRNGIPDSNLKSYYELSSMINIFELIFIGCLSYYHSKIIRNSYKYSLKFIVKTYGVCYIIYVLLFALFILLYKTE